MVCIAMCGVISTGCKRGNTPVADQPDTASTTTEGAEQGTSRSTRDTIDSDPRRASSELDLNTERMIVFKDGHAMFHRKGRAITDDRGQVFTDEVPEDVVLGSLWATSADGVVSIRAERVQRIDTITESQTAVTIQELLKANEGESVTLEWVRPEKKPLQGTIVEVLDRPVHPDSLHDTDEVPNLHDPMDLGEEGGQWVHLRTARGQEVVPVKSIRRIRGAALKTQGTVTHRQVSRTKRLIFSVGEALAGQEVTLDLIYVRPGVRWVPSYRLEEVGDGSEVVLSLQGELYNDAEPLRDTHVDLVVGVPNLRFKDVVSPLTLESTIRRTINASAHLRNDFDNNMLMNSNVAQVYDPRGGSAGAAGGVMELPSSLTATQQKDLTLYSAGRLTLGKGSRATLPLWRQTVVKEDMFSFDYHPVRGAAKRRLSPGQSPLEIERKPVWRKFSLRHRGELAWTTGPVLMLRDGMPLAQELLTYTPSGGSALIPVTVAVNIRGRHESEELARNVINTFQQRHNQDTQILMRATLELTN